jgi:hypothetical protein
MERASGREIPSTKSQIPNKSKIQNRKDQNGLDPARFEFRSLEFGTCLLFGACYLLFRPGGALAIGQSGGWWFHHLFYK